MTHGKLEIKYSLNQGICSHMDEMEKELKAVLSKYGFHWWAQGTLLEPGVRDISYEYKPEMGIPADNCAAHVPDAIAKKKAAAQKAHAKKKKAAEKKAAAQKAHAKKKKAAEKKAAAAKKKAAEKGLANGRPSPQKKAKTESKPTKINKAKAKKTPSKKAKKAVTKGKKAK